MYYYKFPQGYQMGTDLINEDEYELITVQEYNEAMTEIEREYMEMESIEESLLQEQDTEISKDERIAALEEENAALLYKLLTGEDLEDEE